MNIELTRLAHQWMSSSDHGIIELLKKYDGSTSPFELILAIKKIFFKNGIFKCNHPKLENHICQDCGSEQPICQNCKERKWLFSDYGMCGDCWGKIMEGQYVVDG